MVLESIVDYFPKSMVEWLGILSILGFYLLLLGFGVWTSRKRGGDGTNQAAAGKMRLA